MSKRLEVTVYWAYWSDESTSDFTTDYIVTKKDQEYGITLPGYPGPFLRSEKVDILNEWILGEDSLHRHCDLEAVELKLLEGEKVVAKKRAFLDSYEKATVEFMNLL